MLLRFCSAVVLVGLLFVPATAQTVRFNTNVGNFDMVLNPDGDANLQVLVDNMLVYVEGGLYDNSVINREATLDGRDDSNSYILQMGIFLMDSIFPPSTSDEFIDTPITAPDGVRNVIVDADNDGEVDFDTASNLRGTVSLGLSAAGVNSGSNSFFINQNDNSESLDPQGFVPFATIPDMSTIDLIMQLKNVDIYSQPGNLTLSDIPTLDNNTLVYIEKAFVIAATPEGSSASLQSVSVPEPPSLVLAIGALVAIYVLKPSKRG